jgi:hypothetical protein
VGSEPGFSWFNLFSHFHHFTAEPQRLPQSYIFNFPRRFCNTLTSIYRMAGGNMSTAKHTWGFFSTYICRVENRVTRLGEFSLTGRLFTLGSFQKMAEVAQIFRLLYFTVKVMHLFWQKWIRLYIGLFFHKLIWSPWLKIYRTERRKADQSQGDQMKKSPKMWPNPLFATNKT